MQFGCMCQTANCHCLCISVMGLNTHHTNHVNQTVVSCVVHCYYSVVSISGAVVPTSCAIQFPRPVWHSVVPLSGATCVMQVCGAFHRTDVVPISGAIQRCYSVVPSNDVTQWCYSKTLLSGAIQWCYSVVLSDGVTQWWYPMVLISGAIQWCYSVVLSNGVTQWCYTMMLLSGAIQWC